jgi:amidase
MPHPSIDRREFMALSAAAGLLTQPGNAMANDKSAAQFVADCKAKIAALDKTGPKLNAIIEVNPEADAIALAMDSERAKGKTRGPLHGLPVLLKDNIATADGMATTAGSLALDGVRADRDAHLVKRLRDAGAVVLGKTNLSEWANLRSTRSTSGWSGRGGLTRNPHALDRNTSGSSSGSAVAAAAGYAPMTIGTETNGSIVSPSSVNGIVGVKPTVGLVSRAGIIPISHTQDTAGPMCRTVADAAALLQVIAGQDPDDPATLEAPPPPDYGAALKADALRGARIGVVRAMYGRNEMAGKVIDAAIAVMRGLGAEVIDPVDIPNRDKVGAVALEILLQEFRPGVDAYLAAYASNAKVKSMKDVIAFNEANASAAMPFFGQEFLIQAVAKGGLESAEYKKALETARHFSRTEGLDKTFAEHKLGAVIAPTTGPAWLTDIINGDAGNGGSFSSPAAIAGYPHVTVPAGHVYGLPVGLSFVGRPWSEAQLLGFAYAFEQSAKASIAPRFLSSLNRQA